MNLIYDIFEKKKKIALLSTILCVSTLYCMEKPSYTSLPADLKQKIITTALATSVNISQAIAMIKRLSASHGICYDGLTNFTQLVHILVNTFNAATGRTDISTAEIAERFLTPTAQTYVTLGDELVKLMNKQNNSDDIIDLIKNGADINFSNMNGQTPLNSAVMSLNLEGTNILLNAGAKPTYAMLVAVKRMAELLPNEDKRKIMKQLIEDAMNNQQ